MKKSEKIFIYIFILLNSISGLQISGHSMNTIFVALFFLYIVFSWLINGNRKPRISKDIRFLGLVAFSALSCLFSLVYSYGDFSHTSTVLSYLVNCIMYAVAFFLLSAMGNNYKKEFVQTFKSGLIYAARIQAMWGMLQIILYYSAGIIINKIVFVDILKSSNAREWYMGFYVGSQWVMRITGLNFENAMFAIVVCIGAVLEKNKIWKIFLLVVVALSLSRTGWTIEIVYLLYLLFKNIMAKHKWSSILKYAIGIVLIVIVFNIVLKNSPSLQKQVASIGYRITDTTSNQYSASRHLLYYPYGFLIWLTRSNPFQMLIGYGMRCSGIAFSLNPDICSAVNIPFHAEPWTVECDVIALLLSGGIITTFFYYKTIFANRYSALYKACLVIFVGGITYHFHSISYIIFILLACEIGSQVYCNDDLERERNENRIIRSDYL